MNRRHFLKTTAYTMPALAALAAVGCSAAGRRPAGFCGRVPDGLTLREVAAGRLHHRRDGGFTNPFCTESYRRPFALLKWKLFSTNQYRHLYVNERVVPVRINWPDVGRGHETSLTFINHACVLIRDRERRLLVDPVFFGLMPFIKNFSPLMFTPGDMPPPDHVLITHGHYDHLDKPSLAALPPGTHVVTPLGYREQMAAVKTVRHQELDWFDTINLGSWRVTCLPAHHWTMRNPLVGPNTNLWGGYLIRTGSGRTIYLSGDTAYWNGFADIGREADIDLAVINLGAYEPRWFMAQSHLDPAEAVRAFVALRAKRLLVVHWGAFRLGDEPVYLPPQQLRRRMDEAGLTHRLVHLDPGKTFNFPA